MKKILALILVFSFILSISSAYATTYGLVKYNYTYPSTKYKICEGRLKDTWNKKTITSIPGGATQEYCAYGACQAQSSLSSATEFNVAIGVRLNGASNNLSTVILTMNVPKNGKSEITEKYGVGKFNFELNKAYVYHVNSYAPDGVKAVYQGGVHDRQG